MFLVLFGGLFLTLYEFNLFAFLIMALTVAFVIHLYINTYYQVSDNILRIKSGFIIDKKIDISRITKYRKPKASSVPQHYHSTGLKLYLISSTQ